MYHIPHKICFAWTEKVLLWLHTPQYFAKKSLPTVLNVHEVCSSFTEFKPFIEGPKYLINSQA